MVIEQVRPEFTWRLRQSVLYPNLPLYEMEMDEDNEGYHFAVFQNDAPVAVVSLFNRGDEWQFRKFAVDTGLQGKGIGTALLNYITEFAASNGCRRLWCRARLSAIGFYLKAGFNQTGQFLSKGGIDYEVMDKNLTPSLTPQ